jgi:small redox-active disulfide protein 2
MGTGCPKCKTTEKIVRKAVEELGIKAEIVKVDDLQEIINRGIMMTPAVLVDGEAKIVGRIPSPEEIKKLLKK